MFKHAACFTDIHFGEKGNSELHNQDCIEFIKWFIVQAKKHNAETCICLGDYIHNRNTMNILTMKYAMEGLQLLNDNFENVYIITGNHDLYYRENRKVTSLVIGSNLPNVTIVDEIFEKDGVAIVPWLVDNEWKKIKKIKSRYLFGHLEIPGFKLNAMVEMPDHGEINKTHFKNQEYAFSGHFHKRQHDGNMSYIGNPFGHNYADSMDLDRGAMFLEWDGTPEYVNYEDGPRYVSLPLSELIDRAEELVNSKTYVQAKLDMDITYEEASLLKETFIDKYGVRELKIVQSKFDEATEDAATGDTHFESVDQVVFAQLSAIDSENFNKGTLIEIYNSLG